LVPFALVLLGALLSSNGGSVLHAAGFFQSLDNGQVGSRAAQEADYLARGIFWFAAAGAMIWLAFLPLSWPLPPSASNVTTFAVLFVFDALVAFIAGDNPNEAVLQFIWIIFYVGVPMLAFLAAYPFLRISIKPPDGLLDNAETNANEEDA